MVGFKRGQDSKTSLDVGYAIWLKDSWDNIDTLKGRAFIRENYPDARTSRANFEDGFFYAYKFMGANKPNRLILKIKIEDLLIKLENFEYDIEF